MLKYSKCLGNLAPWLVSMLFLHLSSHQRNGQRVRAEQVEDILDLIPRRGQHAFEEFCSALSASDQERIVKDYLKPAVKVVTEQDKVVTEQEPVVTEEDSVVIPSQYTADYYVCAYFEHLAN